MAPSTCASACEGRANRASAWSLWQASTTSSKYSTPCALWMTTPRAPRSMRCTGVFSRASARPWMIFSTYWRAPPATVYHRGRLLTWMRPWLWQKRTIVATGKRSIWSVGQLQMQPSMGKKYQSRNSAEKRWATRKSPRGCISAASSPGRSSFFASSVARRLKRSRSASMRQKRPLSRLRRCANTVDRLVPLHSNWSAPPQPAPGTCTENDMSEGAMGTSSCANSASRWG